ncbi:MAG TPA: DUF1573 domain-containing protein [Thermoanaerobaculia bacterium]|jgi:hypothetical protein
MSDDFGTISARRAREIDVLRKHRESLVKMLEDVDAQLRELGDVTAPVIPPPARRTVEPPAPGHDIDSRPIVNTATYDDEPESVAAQPGSGARVLLIIGVAILALALIGYLIWRASSDRPAAATGTVIEESTAVETNATAPDTVAEAQPVPVPDSELVMTPRTQDYGLVRKGTRVTRQYVFTNNSEEPVTISLARSACRCLYYEYEKLVPPKAKESITVTIDGAKAKAGTLRESVKVTTQADPTVSTSFDVIATVR